VTLAFTILGVYLFFLGGWILYVAIMGLNRVKHDLHPFAKFNAYLALFLFGYPWDLAMNLIVCLCMWRIPKDWLLTGTLKRIINTEIGLREIVASWICEKLLNQFDPKGRHC